jgi:hypothetical protein
MMFVLEKRSEGGVKRTAADGGVNNPEAEKTDVCVASLNHKYSIVLYIQLCFVLLELQVPKYLNYQSSKSSYSSTPTSSS